MNSSAFILVGLLLVLPATTRAGDPEWRSLLPLRQWGENERAEYDEPGSYRASFRFHYSDVRALKGTVTIRTKPDHKLFDLTQTNLKDGKTTQVIYARSPQLAFTISRPAGNGLWTVSQCNYDLDAVRGDKYEERVLGNNFLGLLYPTTVWCPRQKSSLFLSDNPEFVKAGRRDDDGTLIFTMRDDSDLRVKLAPQAQTILRIDQTARLPETYGSGLRRETMIRELQDIRVRTKSRLPVCKSLTYAATNDPAGAVDMDMKVDIQFSDFTDDVPGDELFQLSHYGLPELPRPAGSHSRLYFGIASAVVILALLLGYWARKLRAAGK